MAAVSARPSLKCRLDLTGVDESDRSDLFNQPSTSSTHPLLTNELEEMPLTERLASSSSSSSALDANRKSDKKLKKVCVCSNLPVSCKAVEMYEVTDE